MVNKEAIQSLQNFINSSAFAVLPSNTQEDLRRSLEEQLKELSSTILQEVKDVINNSLYPIVNESDIDFSLIITCKNHVVTIDEYIEKNVVEKQIPEETLVLTPPEPERVQSKSIGFSVLFPDGEKVACSNAKKTFINALRKIGIQRIVESDYKRLFAGYKLVGKLKRQDPGNWQTEVDGWQIYTFMDNEQKMSTLNELSILLDLNLRIFMDDGKEYSKVFGYNPTKEFKVEFADGTIVCEDQAVASFALSIQKIGLEKVANLDNPKYFSGYNLVDRRRKTDNGKKWQQEVDGWYVFTYMNNQRKASLLYELSDRLSCDLKVYIGGNLVDKNGNAEVIPETENVTQLQEKNGRDRTKYSLDGINFSNKRKFAWMVIKKYIETHPDTTYAELKEVFPPKIASGLGVVRSLMDLPDGLTDEELGKRYLMKEEELIYLNDSDIITVCGLWTKERMTGLLDVAVSFGWEIKQITEDGIISDYVKEIGNRVEIKEVFNTENNNDEEETFFGVTFADESYIEEETNFETFVETLRKIGLTRIPVVGIMFEGINLVESTQKDGENQQMVDGMYVYNKLTANQMIECLKKISDYYYLDLEIETFEEE